MARLTLGLALLASIAAGCNSDGADDGAPTEARATDAEGTPEPTVVIVTPPPPPEGVPPQAEGVGQTMTLGRIVRRANAAPEAMMPRVLSDATCDDGIVTLTTDQETIYAALPCDRFWTDEQKALFVGGELAIQLEASEERYRILIETLDGAQTEFTVDGIWVE